MESLIFFSYLSNYMKNKRIEGDIYNDQQSHIQTACFGKDENGYPRIYLEKSRDIGNIDVYTLEYYEPTTQHTIEKQKYYAEKLIYFMENIYLNERRGYILMRKVKERKTQFIKTTIEDSFGDILRKNHQTIIPKNILFPFINTYQLEWAVYLRNKGIEEDFKLISLLENSIQEILNEPNSKIYSFKLINFDHVSQKIMFNCIDNSYYISLITGETLSFELRISGYPDYIPLKFSDPRKSIKELVLEVEALNRLNRLFE